MASRARRCAALTAAFCLSPLVARSQENRIQGIINSRETTLLAGNVHPLAQTKYDQGPVDPELVMRPITLVLKRSAAQQAMLERLLAEQQDRSSPNYHKWLTPEQFGHRFGFSQSDIDAISGWLKSRSFTVVDVPASGNMIVFSGTVQTVQDAFRTSIHRYLVDGEKHIANSEPPSLPVALAPLVLAITGLDDFQPKASGHTQGNTKYATPQVNNTDGSHSLGPGDYAVIYDILPLYLAGYSGSGERVAVVGRCSIGLSDVQAFRTFFSLPPNNTQLILAAGSPDPGPKGVDPQDCSEAALDVEWSGGVASGSEIDYVYATNVLFAVQYAVTQNIAPVVTYSFAACESSTSPSSLASYQSLAKQANAQGITWVAASGDFGPAACDTAFNASSNEASHGLAVAFPASIPEVTAVGGTEFNEGSGTYWASVNGAGYVSALSYIPEQAWNESNANGLAASGGGLSIFYPKPAWQTGPGVPSQNQRAVPDIALTAAAHDGYWTFQNSQLYPENGTSAAAPSFAGILAILNQYEIAQGLQAQPGLGNINPTLYALSQNVPSAFHDITVGNNIVPCVVGSPDCTSGSFGYYAGSGYDMVTGLGSVDASNFVSQWGTQSVNPTSVEVVTALTSNTSGIVNNACTTPPQVASFTTSSPQVWVYFSVTGAQVGDSAGVGFYRPDGTLHTSVNSTVSSVGVNGSECFSDYMNISGAATASYPGTWTVATYWDQSSSPLFTLNFTIAAPTQSSTLQIFPHIASDSQWHTDIFVVNTNSTSAAFTLAFYTDTGAPLPLDGNPLTAGVMLPSNGTAFFRTSPTTTANDGWAQLDASEPLYGVAVFGRQGDDGGYYEASVPLSTPYSAFTVPFDETQSVIGVPFLDGFAVTNTDPNNAAEITCMAYDSRGNILGSELQVGPLNQLQHTEFLMDQQFGPRLAGQRGTLVCESNTQVAAVELRAFSSSPAVSSMPVITNVTSASNSALQVFPHIASDSQWHTDIFILNTNSTSATFTLTFHTDTGGAPLHLDGNPQTRNVTLPPNGMAFFRTSPTSTSNDGWAELSASAALSGVAVFGRHGTLGPASG